MHAFEMFIIRCNTGITPHLPTIIEICSDMIKYDPNYTYDDENEELENGDAMEVDESDDNYEDEVDEYSGELLLVMCNEIMFRR